MASFGSFSDLFQRLFDKYFPEIATGLIALIALWLLRWIERKLRPYFPWSRCCASIQHAKDAVRVQGLGPWLEVTIEKPIGYDDAMRSSMPVLLIANLKGGVGKTTVSANFGASLSALNGTLPADKTDVLLIDFDFQGSLSSMTLLDVTREIYPGTPSFASDLLTGTRTCWKRVDSEGLQNTRKLWVTPSYYDLAGHENRLLVEWLIQEIRSDIRYGLFYMLNIREVRNKFRFIVIDAPPRITTASVQAFCASTHALIPTVLDDLSGEAVDSFLTQLILYKSKLCPHIKITGVFGSLFDPQATVINGGAIETIKRAIERSELPESTWMGIDFSIPRLGELSRAAGERIAYFGGDNLQTLAVRTAFDRFRDEAIRRL